MEIFSYARISVMMNGVPKGYFKCSRGVRQGDSLSPILFCLAEDFLSRWLSKAARDNIFDAMHYSRALLSLHIYYMLMMFLFLVKPLLKI